MEIKKAIVKNYKKITYAELPLEKNLILIQGKNASGKSSLIEAIVSCLGGKNKNISEPIKQGEKRATTTINFEHEGMTGVLEQVFTPGGQSMKIVFKDGKEIRGIQRVAEFVGCSSFDPMEFTNMTEGDQREMILKLSKVDLTEIDKNIHDAEQKRLQAFRDKERAVSPQQDIPEALKIAKEEEISVSALSAEIIKESEIHDKYNHAQKEIKQWADAIIDKTKQIERIRLDIKHCESRVDKFREVKNTIVDLTKLREKIDSAESVNINIRHAKEVIKQKDEFDKLNEEYEKCKDAVKDARESKESLLKEAKMPVKGLSVTDSGVKYNNLPYKQINTAEQILVGVKIALQDPANKLKFVFIERGSELDSDSINKLQELIDYCATKNVKVHIVVGQARDTAQENGFFLKEGKIINN